jgi:hypothetical protein
MKNNHTLTAMIFSVTTMIAYLIDEQFGLFISIICILLILLNFKIKL